MRPIILHACTNMQEINIKNSLVHTRHPNGRHRPARKGIRGNRPGRGVQEDVDGGRVVGGAGKDIEDLGGEGSGEQVAP